MERSGASEVGRLSVAPETAHYQVKLAGEDGLIADAVSPWGGASPGLPGIPSELTTAFETPVGTH